MAAVPNDVREEAGGGDAARDAADSARSTRERLVAAAARVFEEEGYDGARVSHIAREAGLTTGAIYANFAGKHDLLMEAIGSRSSDEIDDLLVAFLTTRFDDVLRALGRRLVSADGKEPESLLLDALGAARRDEDMARSLRKGVVKREELFASLVDQGVGRGALDDDVPVDAFARLAMLLSMGALTLRALDLEPPDKADWATVVDRLVDAFVSQEKSDKGGAE